MKKNNKLKQNLINLIPYTPGEQINEEGFIKLNANENPYPPSPDVENALKKYDYDRLAAYPDNESNQLTDALSEYFSVNRDNVFVGNGSDEVLALSFKAFFNSGKSIYSPEITYSFYAVWAKLFSVSYRTFKLGHDFKIDIDKIPADNGGIVLANPNALTGLSISRSQIRSILEKNKNTIVIIDEAYIDFGGESCVDMIEEYDNMIVTQTFSKGRSLAGMRIGYAFGSSELIRTLKSVKNSFNSYPLDQLAELAGVKSLEDRKYHEEIVNKICVTRDRVRKELIGMGFDVGESAANFLLIKDKNAATYKDYLFDNGIMVRYFREHENMLRVSIGTDDQMNTFLDAMKEAKLVIQ